MTWAIIRKHMTTRTTVSVWGEGDTGYELAHRELERWCRRSHKRHYYGKAKRPGLVVAVEDIKIEHRPWGPMSLPIVVDQAIYTVEEVPA